MSPDVETRSCPPGSRFPAVGLLLLFLAEPIVLVSRFSARALRDSDDPRLRVAYQAYYLSFLGITVLAALLAFARPAVAQLLEAGRQGMAEHRHRLATLVAQLACFAALYVSTGWVFEGDPETSRDGFAAWVASGLGTLVLALLSLVPPRAAWRVARRTPRSLFVVIGLGILAGLAGFAVRTWFWEPLGSWTIVVAHGFASLFTDEITSDRASFLIGTPRFLVEIVPECSGYEGIGLTWVFVGSYLWMFRERLRFPRALWLVVLATAAVWTANAARIAALVLIGHFYSGEVASGGFHSKAGWILFCGVALGAVAFSRRWTYISREARSERSLQPESVAYVLPLLAVVGTGMVTGMLAEGLDTWYGARLVAGAAVLFACRRVYRPAKLSASVTPVALGLAVATVWALLVHDVQRDAVVRAGLAEAGAAQLAAFWITRVLGSVVLIPVVEELAFRGYLTRRLIASDVSEVPMGEFRGSACLLSSLLFGLAHHEPLAGSLAGLAYAAAFYRRGRLGDAILAHAVTNGALGVFALSTGRFSSWI